MKKVFLRSKEKKSGEGKSVNGASSSFWENTLSALKLRSDENTMDEWFYCFSPTKIKKDHIVLRYSGNGDPSEFDEDKKALLKKCLFDAFGCEVNLKIEWGKDKKSKNNRCVRKLVTTLVSIVLICAAVAVMVLGTNYISNLSFEENFYQVGSGKINGNLRIIQLSDLHNSKFGKDNSTLVKRITALKPDVIVATGDMVDKHGSTDTFVDLCKKLSKVAPIYVIYGNNEDDRVYKSDMTRSELDEMTGKDPEKLIKSDDELKSELEKVGATVLLNGEATVEIGENTIDIYGVLTSNPSAFWEYCEDSYDKFLNKDTDHFKLMLCHEPYIFEEFEDGYWGDLILAGHTHGGIIRIPYLGGLYERKNGFLPETKDDIDAYIAGEYDVSDASLIVSRGLSNRGLIRIRNKPELVVIDVNRY